MYPSKDAVLATLKRLPSKPVSGTYGVGTADLIHALCGNKPDNRVAQHIKAVLEGLESEGEVTLLRMDCSTAASPILGIQLKQEY